MGRDYLAVDRVGTEIMGADFDSIRYLNYLWDWGFGEADLNNTLGGIFSMENNLTPSPSYLSIKGLSILYFGLKPYDNPIEAYFRNEGSCG